MQTPESRLHLVKLCVGIDTVETLRRLLAHRTISEHITRMMPARRGELLDGGSLYWVIAGAIRARQKIAGIEQVTSKDSKSRCRLLLERTLTPTTPWPRRPFQGWRYLSGQDAPPDLDAVGEPDMPEKIRAELSALGLL